MNTSYFSWVGYGLPFEEETGSHFVRLVDSLSKENGININALAINEKGFKFGDEIFSKFLNSPKASRFKSAVGFQSKRDVNVPGEYDAYFFLNPAPSSIGIFIRKEKFRKGEGSITNLLETLVSEFRPNYGYACNELSLAHPELYAVGLNSKQTIGFSGKEYEASLVISRWSSIGMRKQVYNLGFIRDVYEYNVLNKEHLARKIDNVNFGDWIKIRGIVIKHKDLWIWKVDYREIERMRSSLVRAGIIFDWKLFSDRSIN